MRSASPSLRPALDDNPFLFDGGPAWRTERALDAARLSGSLDQIPAARLALTEAMAPPPPAWFGKRLPVLWTLFMTARQADPRALTVWMAETAYLLGDLPHDIVAFAIDEAIKASGHGFMPSVGEIRRVADPLVAARRQDVERLEMMETALGDPVASETRAQRWREHDARERAEGDHG